MYTTTNYPNKKALIADFKAGKIISVFQPGPFSPSLNGQVCLEGPHYPQPHRWYLSVTIKEGVITFIKK